MADRPSVNIIFEQKASTLAERSGDSICVLLLKKKGAEEGSKDVFKEIMLLSDITEEDKVSAEAKTAISYAIANSPKKVIISNMGFKAVKDRLIKDNNTNFIITDIEEEAECTTMATDVVSLANNKGYGCYVIAKDETPSQHDMHYIALAGDTYVSYYDTNDKKLSEYDIKALYCGAIASCGVHRSLTNYTLPLVKSVEVKEDAANFKDLTKKGIVYAEMMAGKPRVVSGVNTAEVSGKVTEDMQHIEVVQTMDMICKDITDTFCEYYRGAYKNNYTNQLLLIAAINGYFRDLAAEEVLDNEFDNKCEIDVEEQRAAWLEYGKEEAADWSEDVVKTRSFGRKVFLLGNIKICQSMEDLVMYITLE